jgi:hypothetical protein
VDLGDDPARAGDEVILFGPGDRGEPTAQDWADAVGTISYEIVTGIRGRIPLAYSGLSREKSELARSSEAIEAVERSEQTGAEA